jgi:hypothetical protein
MSGVLGAKVDALAAIELDAAPGGQGPPRLVAEADASPAARASCQCRKCCSLFAFQPGLPTGHVGEAEVLYRPSGSALAALTASRPSCLCFSRDANADLDVASVGAGCRREVSEATRAVRRRNAAKLRQRANTAE